MIIENLIKVKKGSSSATEDILKDYDKYIYF